MMDFEEARMVALYVFTHELLMEHIEWAADQPIKEPPEREAYLDAAYAELVAERHWIIHLLDYTEEEVEYTCNNHWRAFVDPNDELG